MFNWYYKAKNWVKKLFTKTDSLESSKTILEPLKTPVVEVPIEAGFIKKPSALEVAAREQHAIGPSDLREKITQKISRKCVHDLTVIKQVWVKVSPGKFELQNEAVCKHCKESTIQAIASR